MNNVSYIIIACYPDKGMKSYGSKSLIEFNNKKLLQHQIDSIKAIGGSNYEIIVISDFDTHKLNKYFGGQVTVLSLSENNPIYTGCKKAKYDHLIFIDYGCIFKPSVLKKIMNQSSIICTQNTKSSKLDIGCIVDNKEVKHIFFDLPNNKFCNIFSINCMDKNKILYDTMFSYCNLLVFEVINKLIDTGSKFLSYQIDTSDFIYFNHMEQKNATNKFIKKITN